MERLLVQRRGRRWRFAPKKSQCPTAGPLFRRR